VTDAMVSEFRDLVEKSKIKIDEADWQKDLPFIKAMIRYENRSRSVLASKRRARIWSRATRSCSSR
jgi:hypothetical protein